ncbi:acetyl-CoA hydrolase/transferase C-terminal domain-containing protein [Nocardiopsis sp. N85]|uniref:acetyl-CoA hydrolase/transferase C-terminal domain-containing protein n=1 Tax=Nocardiopsis sp. N85 TaxID=3029400 RepID=UPI00237F6048|nr:acetyl-CoA hydrolase/transferase C-terminal domain-containing protein [Nocardiopsis sp. N85]MDE3720203.1 acetyl-CoA hydrolase/transferase C-terminal domain-containing protein [Nocardiopsis sp. N85]
MESLSDLVRPGATIALGDGFGAPRGVTAELCAAAAQAGGVRLVLGWVPEPDPALDPTAFADVRTVMPGWGLRDLVDRGLIAHPPVRMSGVPALLHGPWRPDLLIASLVPVPGGYAFGSEVSWQRTAIDAGATVAGVVSRALPRADAGAPLPADRVVVIGGSDRPAGTLRPSPTGPDQVAIARHLAPLISEGVRLQLGFGAVPAALAAELRVPVRIDSGLLPEAVVDLDERGLLLGDPVAMYLVGGPRLHAWADGRPLLHPVERVLDPGRLSADPFIAINTAVEIDHDGQVNVEGTARGVLGGIGGHADYAAAATRSIGGLSVIAIPTRHRGRPTLVERLSRPVTTPSQDVEVVVTERGVADLRGLSRAERRAALADLWGANRH